MAIGNSPLRFEEIAAMAREFGKARTLLGLLAFTALGCGSDPTAVEPTPAEAPNLDLNLDLGPPLRGGRGEVPQLAMIVPADGGREVSLWERAARLLAGDRRALFEVVRAVEGSDPAAAVEAALESGASALIVYPEDPEAIAPALLEARSERGVPSLSILEPIPVPEEAEPIPVVTRGGYDEMAPRLVAALQEDAPLVDLPTDGPAVLLVDREALGSSERAEALRSAAAEAGIPLFGGEPLVFEGGSGAAEEALRGLLPEPGEGQIAYVLATDDEGFKAATNVRGDLPTNRRFLVAGFLLNDRLNRGMVMTSFAVAAAVCLDADLARQAIRSAIALHRGEEVPDEVLVPPEFLRAPDVPNPSGGMFGPGTDRPEPKSEPYVPPGEGEVGG